MKIVIRRLCTFEDEDQCLMLEEGFRVSVDDKVILEQWKEWFVEDKEILQTTLEMIGHSVDWESDYDIEDDYTEYTHDPDGNPYDPDDLPGHR